MLIERKFAGARAHEFTNFMEYTTVHERRFA